MSYRLLIFPDPLTSTCILRHDIGFTVTAQPDTHFTGRRGQSFVIPDTWNGGPIPQGFGALLTISHPGKVELNQKGKLWVKRDDVLYPWEQEQTSALDCDDFRLSTEGTVPAPGPTVGCINHKLSDAQSWFYDHIKRSPGQSAMDYRSVLITSGIPAGNPAGVKPNYLNGFFGITQQISGGIVRGRIFLPTAVPDSLGFYANANDIFNGSEADGTLTWSAFKYVDGPPYVPGPCDLT